MIHDRQYAIGEIVDDSIVTEYIGDGLACIHNHCKYENDVCNGIFCLASERIDDKCVYFKPLNK